MISKIEDTLCVLQIAYLNVLVLYEVSYTRE